MPSINNAFKWFFQPAEFKQLSTGKKWAVGIVSFLPAVTVVGIIASPFIWKGMVSALSDKKVTPGGAGDSSSQAGKLGANILNPTGGKKGTSVDDEDTGSTTSEDSGNFGADTDTGDTSDTETSETSETTGSTTSGAAPATLDKETLQVLNTLSDVIHPHGTPIKLQPAQMVLLEEPVPKGSPITYTLYYKPKTGNLDWKTKFPASPTMIQEINDFIAETERKGQVVALKAAGVQFFPITDTQTGNVLKKDGDFVIYYDGIGDLSIFARQNGKNVPLGGVKKDDDLFKKLQSFNLWPPATTTTVAAPKAQPGVVDPLKTILIPQNIPKGPPTGIKPPAPPAFQPPTYNKVDKATTDAQLETLKESGVLIVEQDEKYDPPDHGKFVLIKNKDGTFTADAVLPTTGDVRKIKFEKDESLLPTLFALELWKPAQAAPPPKVPAPPKLQDPKEILKAAKAQASQAQAAVADPEKILQEVLKDKRAHHKVLEESDLVRVKERQFVVKKTDQPNVYEVIYRSSNRQVFEETFEADEHMQEKIDAFIEEKEKLAKAPIAPPPQAPPKGKASIAQTNAKQMHQLQTLNIPVLDEGVPIPPVTTPGDIVVEKKKDNTIELHVYTSQGPIDYPLDTDEEVLSALELLGVWPLPEKDVDAIVEELRQEGKIGSMTSGFMLVKDKYVLFETSDPNVFDIQYQDANGTVHEGKVTRDANVRKNADQFAAEHSVKIAKEPFKPLAPKTGAPVDVKAPAKDAAGLAAKFEAMKGGKLRAEKRKNFIASLKTGNEEIGQFYDSRTQAQPPFDEKTYVLEQKGDLSFVVHYKDGNDTIHEQAIEGDVDLPTNVRFFIDEVSKE